MQLEEGSVQINAEGRPDAAGAIALAAKGYDAAASTQLHHDWKDANLGELLALSNLASDSMLFLDHWVTSAEDKRLRTTDALLERRASQRSGATAPIQMFPSCRN